MVDKINCPPCIVQVYDSDQARNWGLDVCRRHLSWLSAVGCCTVPSYLHDEERVSINILFVLGPCWGDQVVEIPVRVHAKGSEC